MNSLGACTHPSLYIYGSNYSSKWHCSSCGEDFVENPHDEKLTKKEEKKEKEKDIKINFIKLICEKCHMEVSPKNVTFIVRNGYFIPLHTSKCAD